MATLNPVQTQVANGEEYNESTVRGKLAASAGPVSVNGQKVTEVANGTDPTDAVNKSQLDAVAGAVQKIRRTIVQPADGSDFFVTIPTATAADTYEVAPCMVNGGAAVIVQCPDLAAGDRTTTQFRVLTSAPLANGDSISFILLA